MTVHIRNPRAIVPPSQRIHNWHALPVQGAGARPFITARRLERICNAAIVGSALLVAWLCASKGWNW